MISFKTNILYIYTLLNLMLECLMGRKIKRGDNGKVNSICERVGYISNIHSKKHLKGINGIFFMFMGVVSYTKKTEHSIMKHYVDFCRLLHCRV